MKDLDESEELRKKRNMIIIGLGLVVMMLFTAIPFNFGNSVNSSSHQADPMVTSGVAPTLSNMVWLCTNHRSYSSTHNILTMKYSVFYNSSAGLVLYCLETCVQAENGANIAAGNNAITSNSIDGGSTIHQAMFNPESSTTTQLISGYRCEILYIGGRPVHYKVPIYTSVTTYTSGNFQLNLPGNTFSPGNEYGQNTGSSTTSWTISAGVSGYGASAGATYGVSTTTNYYSFITKVQHVQQNCLAWIKDNYMKGTDWGHFTSMGLTPYQPGESTTIQFSATGNTTYTTYHNNCLGQSVPCLNRCTVCCGFTVNPPL